MPAGDGAIWMVRYADGHRGLPGGRHDQGEATFEQTIQRELQEEIGAQATHFELVDAWLMLDDPRREHKDCLVLLYLAEMVGEPSRQPSADGELAVKVPLKEVPQTELREPYRRALQTLIKQGRLQD